ncbi:MAG: hypothetical protein ACI3Z9_02675 [Candidatus Onthomorpha sp.]
MIVIKQEIMSLPGLPLAAYLGGVFHFYGVLYGFGFADRAK